ncbi:MAG TPA: hypothetical protein VI837_06855 [Blastocatellia bacterium]|nr:hypothetical protein [Blastocatellia bacterium]
MVALTFIYSFIYRYPQTSTDNENICLRIPLSLTLHRTPLARTHAEFGKLTTHLFQATFLALVDRLIKSVPVQNLHAKDYLG